MNILAAQFTFHMSRVQVTALLINYQTTLIPLDRKEHFVGWHQVCDVVLNIKHGGTGTKTAFTLVQVLHR